MFKDKKLNWMEVVSFTMLGVITVWLLGLPLWAYLIKPDMSSGWLWSASIFDWIALLLIPVVITFNIKGASQYRLMVEETADRYGVKYTKSMKNDEILKLVNIIHEKKNNK